jgi:hypothetical protein
MDTKDRIEFRKLQVIFFTGMSENPTDTNRMENFFVILEKFIDTIVERECSKILTKSASIILKHGGGLKN